MLRRALIPCLIVLCAPAAASADPTAQASKSCNISGKERNLGATYVTSLSAKGTSCGKAESVVRAFNECRGSGKSCGGKALGYKCKTKVVNSSPTQYIAKATCKKGDSKVKFDFQQNT